MTTHIGRRELLAAFSGATAAWPLAAGAQQPAKVPRVGILSPAASDFIQGDVGAGSEPVMIQPASLPDPFWVAVRRWLAVGRKQSAPVGPRPISPIATLCPSR
jgi:hypothetical protein